MATGLDLIAFETICWAETDYSVYVMRQASRRSWRIGQTRPVKVVFMAYRNTLQADALKLVAQKLQSSLAVEGELPEDGLAAYGDDGDDLMMALARRIVGGEEEDAETVEEVFARARDAEAAAEEFLVDDGWRSVEAETEAPQGSDGGTDGYELFGDGPTEPLPTGAEEDRKPQRSLFSWSEFLAEPVNPRRRNGKPQPASLSMFEWAMERDREREEETAGATR